MEGTLSSGVVSAATFDDVPPAPVQGFTATPKTDNTIELIWTANTEPDLAGAAYRIVNSADPATTIATFGKTDTLFVWSLGVPATTYSFDIIAIDTSGRESTPVSASATTFDNLPPTTLTGVTATLVSDTQVDLSWNASNEADLDHYVIRYSENNSITCDNYQTISVVKTSTSWSRTGLTPNTGHCYQIMAVDTSNQVEAYWGATLVSVWSYAAPQNLSATAASSTEIELTWDVYPAAITGYYRIYRDGVLVGRLPQQGNNNDLSQETIWENYQPIQGNISSTRFRDTSLTAGQAYAYTIAVVKYDSGAGDYEGIRSATANATTIAGGMVAYYPFNGNANDESGIGNNHAAANGATLIVDRFGNANSAYLFDGVNDSISLSAAANGIPTGDAAYTISAWIKADTMGTKGIVGWGEYPWDNQVTALRLMDTGIRHYWWSNDQLVNTADLSGAWHHIIATFDGTNRRIYLDGSQIAADTPTGHIVPHANNFRIGLTSSSEFFDGAIDDVRIYNVDLTAAAIQTLYQQESTGMAAYYPFDGNANDTVGGNHGTVNGASLTTDRYGNANSAYLFDGSDDSISLTATASDIPVGNTPYTLSTWIKADVMGAKGIVGWGGYGSGNQVTALRLTDTGLRHYWWDTDLLVNTAPLVNVWHHVVATFDGTNRRIYLDGNQIALDTPIGHVVPYANNFSIGLTDYYFDGAIDDVRIYYTGLSAAAIQTLYQLETPIPAQVQSLSATTVSQTQIDLSWTANTESDLDHYNIYRDNVLITAVNAPTTIYSNTGLSATTAYSYEVSVVDTLSNEGARSAAVSATTAGSIPTNGLVAYYAFNGNANDSAGGNHGVVNGAVLTTDRNSNANSAYIFDGSDDFISLAAANGIPIGNTPYTISAWIKADAMGAKGFVGWGGYGSANQATGFRLTDTGLRHYWWDTDQLVNTADLTGAWHHVVATFDDTNRKIYLDGSEITVDTPSGHAVPHADNFTIGKTYSSEYFDGAIDDVRIYNVGLTAGEIQALYQE